MGRRRLEPQIWRTFGGKTAGAFIGGELVTIDAEDVAKVSGYRWLLQRHSLVTIDGNNKKIYFSRILMNDDQNQYYHIDKDVTNYCKRNLTCKESIKHALRSKSKRKSSIYKGVSLSKRNDTWFAELSVNKVRYRLGYFSSEIRAAMAYDRKLIELNGDEAYTNAKMVRDGVIKPPGDAKKFWNRLPYEY